MMKYRGYDPDRDKKSVARIWREIGWLEKKEYEKAMDAVLKCGRTMVAEVNGEAECMVNTSPGTLRYLEEDLDISLITGVATSRVARKRGLASTLTAKTLTQEAACGMKVALLGIFEQGYYNQLGFGNGSYEHWCTFDPADLNVDVRPPIPARITTKEWKMAHRSRLARLRRHGTCSVTPPEMTQADMLWSENGFGLGYIDAASGELTHHFWCSTKAVGNGPYTIRWMSYRTKKEFHCKTFSRNRSRHARSRASRNTRTGCQRAPTGRHASSTFPGALSRRAYLVIQYASTSSSRIRSSDSSTRRTAGAVLQGTTSSPLAPHQVPSRGGRRACPF